MWGTQPVRICKLFHIILNQSFRTSLLDGWKKAAKEKVKEGLLHTAANCAARSSKALRNILFNFHIFCETNTRERGLFLVELKFQQR